MTSPRLRQSQRRGPGGCIGDIGTHAFHLLEYISGLKVTAINATLRSVVPGRQAGRRLQRVPAAGAMARRLMACSQVAVGEMNELRCASMARRARSIGGSRIRTG
jgi:predicted dehydrogenase